MQQNISMMQQYGEFIHRPEIDDHLYSIRINKSSVINYSLGAAVLSYEM